MPKPGPRKGASKNRDFHLVGVGCACFAVMNGQRNADKIGNPTVCGDFDKLHHHAEQRWWADQGNRDALKRASSKTDILRIEFEVTKEVCPGCRARFNELVRQCVPKGIPVLVFEMRDKKCFEVNDDGTLGPGTNWS